MTDKEDLAGEPSNADVQFHYVVNSDGHVHWFPTAVKAHDWIDTHKRDHGTYCRAHSGELARKIVQGVIAPLSITQKKRKPRTSKAANRPQSKAA